MKKRLVFMCVLAVLLLTCSKKSTNPPDTKPPVRTPFEISYTADPSRAINQHILADARGTIAAYDKDSVAFKLTIPPHALPSDTTITITPLTSLLIGGPGGDSCPACTGSDILCCYHGALFEPSGLILDSAVTLTISFPLGAPMPFANHPLIAFLDSSGNRCEAAYTEIDTVANTLSAQLIHFSGYFVDDGRYDRLEEEVYEAAERLTAAVGTKSFYIALWPMINLHRSCSLPFIYMGDTIVYPDLAASIERIMLDAYTRHANIISDRSFSQPLCDAIGDLYEGFMNIDDLDAFSNFSDFGSINGSLRSDYKVFVNRAANEGYRLCEADSCDQGMELLACAHEAIRLSLYSEIDFDPDFCASVNNWMLECRCGIDVSIFSDKEVVHKIAVSESDAENCIVRYSAGVHNNVTNEPVEGAHVQFHELIGPHGTHFIGSGDTDSAGRCEIIYKGSDFGVECGDNVNHRVFAGVGYNSKVYYSDTVSVAVRGLRIAVSVNFQAQHSVTGGESNPGYSEEASGSIIGTITGPGNAMYFDSSCWEGGFSMDWAMALENPSGQQSSVGRLLNPKTAFYAIAGYATDSAVTVPGTSVSVKLLTTIIAHLNSLQMPYAVEWSSVTSGGTYCDTSSQCVFGGCGLWHWWTLGFATPPTFQVTDGSCEPFLWTRDTLGTSTTQTVTVEPVF